MLIFIHSTVNIAVFIGSVYAKHDNRKLTAMRKLSWLLMQITLLSTVLNNCDQNFDCGRMYRYEYLHRQKLTRTEMI